MTRFNQFTIITLILAGLLSACNSSNSGDENSQPGQAIDPKLAMETKIDSLNKAMMDVFYTTGKPDLKTAMYAVQAYEYFAGDYPDDPKSGEYLMKAGEIYENVIKDNQRAIRRYQSAFLHESSFEKKPMALFRSSSLYSDMGDTTRAIEGFEMFIEKYPTHDFAKDAKQMIKIVRMGGMEEFIKNIQSGS